MQEDFSEMEICTPTSLKEKVSLCNKRFLSQRGFTVVDHWFTCRVDQLLDNDIK